MKRILTLVLIIQSAFLFAQNPEIPNANFSTSSVRPCPFDSTQMLLQADGWLIYQTLDDTWNGVVDSTKCIGVKDSLNKLIIMLDQTDVSKPVFVKSLLDDSTKVLLTPDWLYTAGGSIEMATGAFVNFSPNCANGLCSGIIVGVEIPDSTGTSTYNRIYVDGADSGTDRFFEACVVTEYFEENFLKEVIFKFKLLGTQAGNLWFRPFFTNIEKVDEYFIGRIKKDTIVPDFSYNPNDSSYFLSMNDIASEGNFFSGSYLLMYQDSTYPSPAHPSYLELTPETNDTFPKTINLFLEFFQTLHPQPFTEFRGGLVVGSDSIRHPINLINEGGTFCFGEIFIDFTFGHGNNYIHQGGHIDFGGATSCMRFQEGSALKVADETYFEYGKNGRGMLALATGGTIELGKNSTLFIDNTVALYELDKLHGVVENQQIYMELNKGSHLAFGENAKLTNKYSVGKKMKLNIYMNGGTLDISKLSATERAVIHLIYPEAPTRFQDNVTVYPNPTSGQVNFSMILEIASEVQIEGYDTRGQLVFSKKEDGQKGENEILVETESLEAGIYFFKVKTLKGEAIEKVVVY